MKDMKARVPIRFETRAFLPLLILKSIPIIHIQSTYNKTFKLLSCLIIYFK